MVNTIKKGVSRRALVWAICLLVLLLTVSCKKESPTVSAADLVARATDTLPGYNYPSVMAVYPLDGATGVPRDTSYVIVFNIPVDAGQFDQSGVGAYNPADNISITSTSFPLGLDNGTHYTISPAAGSTTVATITFIGPFSPIPANDVVNISILGGIQDIGHTAYLNNPGVRTFTVGAASDTTPPAPNLGSRFPAPASIDRPRTTTASIIITEANGINPTTVNSATFWLEETISGTDVPCSISVPAGANPTITLTPASSLATDMQYTVTLTTGVRDLSGNPLSVGTSWTFRTIETDPVAGAPTITDGPNCTGFNATGTTAYLNWTTNESTIYTLRYGRGDDVTSNVSDLVNYYCFHGLSLALPSAGKRYWAQFNIGDIVDITGTGNAAAYGPVVFNAPTTEVPTDVHSSGTNNQILPYAIPNRFPITNPTGIFLFYTDMAGGFRHLYGQRYSSALAAQWGVPTGLFTANQQHYFQSAVEDEHGGVIVLANRSGSGIYAKRINADGSFFNWGVDADAAGDNGIAIDNNGANDGTSACAVPVYTGQIVEVAEGTVEREAFAGNLFKDDWTAAWGDISDFTDADLQVGNYVLNTDTHALTTVTAKPAVFRHMIQTAAPIASGNNYVIADNTASEAVTVQDHYIYTTPSTPVFDRQSNGTNMFYTEHYTSAFLTLGDVVYDGANGGIVTGLNTIDFGGSPYTGARLTAAVDNQITGYAIAPPPYFIQDNSSGIDFGSFALVDDLVYNVDNNDYAFVNVLPISPTDTLEIDGAASFDDTEHYRIYRGDYCLDHLATAVDPFYQITVNWNMGLVEPNPITIYDSYNNTATTLVSEASPYPNPLFDNEADFVASGVTNGNIVIDFDGRQIAQVDGSVYAPRRHMLRMNGDIAGNGEEYGIIRFVDGVTTMGDIAAVGKATGASAGHLVDSTVGAFAAVLEGDVVYNHTDNRYAMVTTVTANDLTLSRDALFGAGDRYIVFRQRGVLYVWTETGNIYVRTMSMRTGTTQLRATVSPFAGTQPHAIPDGAGNALLVYRDGANVIQARLLNSRGATIGPTIPIDTVHANMSIIKVERDGNSTPDQGGAVVLYTYGGGANLAVQWVRNNAGTLDVGVAQPVLWPVGGNTITGAATTTQDMFFDYNFGLPYAIVTYEQASKIYARSVGQIAWGPIGVSTPATGIQQKPRIYVRGPETIILWEDNRFLSNVGYGIFGMKVATNTGVKDAGWRANTSGADDYNGVAVILNKYNQFWPSQGGAAFSMCVMPYNNGNEAAVFYEDYRESAENANIGRFRFDNFVP